MDREEMFEAVMNKIYEDYGTTPPLSDGKISKSFLGSLTDLDLEELDETDIVDISENLDRNYGHIAKLYGFENFYDLYQFACANDDEEKVSKAGQKEFSKLKKVKRTVTRNGRPTVMTFYENPNKETEGNKDDIGKEDADKQPETPEQQNAKEITSKVIGDFQKPVKIKDLKLIKKMHNSMSSGCEFNGDCDQYSVLQDDQGFTRGIIGIKEDGDYLTIPYIASDAYTDEMQLRGFYTLILTALQTGFGAKYPHDGTRITYGLAEDTNMTLVGEFWQIEYPELQKTYGTEP